MKRFRRILVYLAGAGPESTALRRAARLARQNKAEICILQVVPEESPLSSVWKALDPGQALSPRDQLVGVYEELASEAVESLEEVGISAQYRVREGKPFLEILQEAERLGADLVIKDAQGSGPGEGGLFGSTGLHLLRKAAPPVWLVKGAEPQRYHRILVAVDPDPTSKESYELAQDLLRLADSVATAEGAELEIVHAWWLWAEDTLRSPRLRIAEAEIRRLLKAAAHEAQERLDSLLESFRFTARAHRTTIEKGRPFEVVADRAADADLVVMGTISRSGVPGLLIGNTAELVFQRLNTSLLTVKPKDFVSPVRL